MEMILLFFCLTSVVITSVIVALELRGDKTLSKQSYKGEINTINFHGQQILAKDKNTNEQLRNRVFETLDRQLNQLGYVAKEFAKIGTEISIEVRKKMVPAVIIKPPFV